MTPSPHPDICLHERIAPMDREICREAIHHSAFGFAYHEAVFDASGRMVDYIFREINPAFEELTGLKKENILNRRFLGEIARDEAGAAKWVDMYRQVLSERKMVEFEDFSKEYDKHYSVKAYPSGPGHFVTIFHDRTFEKKMLKISQQFIRNVGEPIDHDAITEFAREIAGADYAAFNLFKENGRDFSTLSISGISENIIKAMKLLGFPVIGRDWPYDPVREEKTKANDITHFASILELTGKVLPETVIAKLNKTFGLGEVVVAKIRKENKVLGDFTLFYKRGARLQNRDLLLLYMSQLGLFIEKYRLDVALKASREMFYTLAERAPVGFVSCTLDGEITYANQRLLDILDSPSYEATKRINLLQWDKLRVAGFSQKLRECMDNGRLVTYEAGYTSLWGKYSWLKIYITPRWEKDAVIGANIVLDDISDKKISEDELKEKASKDALTKAFNRNALDTVLADRLLESGRKGSICCLGVVDIDDFKRVNDSYGHKAGDSVLQQLASRVKQELKESDLVIRTGGDEFLIYLHDVQSPENAAGVIDRLFTKLSAKYTLDQDSIGAPQSLEISCSIGVSLFPRDGQSVELLMAKADEALYEIKRSGKANYSFFCPKTHP